jgi:hypothetical protein
MTAGEAQVGRSMLAEVVGELEAGGRGRPADIARRLGPDWTEADVVAVLSELLCDGVVGHNHDVGFWWVA